MTHAERLIHQLCKEASLTELEAYKERQKQINEHKYITRDKLPKGVRAALSRWTAALKTIDREKRLIESHGFHPPYNPDLTDDDKKLLWNGADKEHEANNEHYATYKEKLAALKTAAIISTLGQTPTEAKGVLVKLQKDLEAL